MIKARFVKTNGLYSGFMISGHAGVAPFGQDIVCAGVSSSVMLTVNTITDFFGADAKVDVTENRIMLKLNTPDEDEAARALIFSLETHLRILEEQYGNIAVRITNR